MSAPVAGLAFPHRHIAADPSSGSPDEDVLFFAARAALRAGDAGEIGAGPAVRLDAALDVIF
jgi:hypothetical protein